MKKYILLLIRIVLGVLFLISAYSKLDNSLAFAGSVWNYQVFGEILSRWIAVGVPLLECLLGVLLIGGLWLGESLIITAGLYLVFDGMILQAFIRGLDISCGCFSSSGSSPIGFRKIFENFILTAMAFWALAAYLQAGKELNKKGKPD